MAAMVDRLRAHADRRPVAVPDTRGDVQVLPATLDEHGCDTDLGDRSGTRVDDGFTNVMMSAG